jgi:predicted phosphodiesterase
MTKDLGTFLSQNAVEFIEVLPEYLSLRYANKKITVVDGSYFNTSEFIINATQWTIKQANCETTNSNIIIAGHCGLPFYHDHEEHLWLNLGVIGIPAKEGSPKVWYAILDIDTNMDEPTFKHHTLDYYPLTSPVIIDALLPKEYAQTLITGIWDNTEILPQKKVL